MTSIRSFHILDSLQEQDYDDIVHLASVICQTPISLITIVDEHRQWFKSNKGLSVSETHRDYAFCAHAINKPTEALVVRDARKDERFIGNPLVVGDPHIVFYAGIPLVDDNGHALGTLCVIDKKPRELDPEQLVALRALSNQVMRLLELRKRNMELEATREEIGRRNQEMEQFSYVVTHDIKSSTNIIAALSELLEKQYKNSLDPKGGELVTHLSTSAAKLKNFCSGVVSFFQTEMMGELHYNDIDLNALSQSLKQLIDPLGEHDLEFAPMGTIKGHETALTQILLNLISNAIRYNDSERVSVQVTLADSGDRYLFSVRDNGRGLDDAEIAKLFGAFSTLGQLDRFNKKGTGIGLNNTRKLIEKMGGKIEVRSVKGEGSIFSFTLAKHP